MALTSEQIYAIWNKAEYVNDECERLGFRKDGCTAWIRREDYGNRDSDYGWEADHKKAVANGGSNSQFNLAPLHWENNAAKSDGPLVCAVKSSGNKNVRVGR